MAFFAESHKGQGFRLLANRELALKINAVTPRSTRIRDGILGILVALVLAAGLGAFVFRSLSAATPTLEAVRAQARGKHFAAAREILARYLEGHPTSSVGHLLMGQLATEPADPLPELALAHLDRVRPDGRREAASVAFLKGKAQYQRKRYDLAEEAWNEALRIDPLVPEAGWALLDLLDLEGRSEDAHRLGMKLHANEPDPRDQARLLLEMSRIDVDKVAPGSLVQIFQPLHETVPDSLQPALILGLALVHDSRPMEGLAVLKDALSRHPDSPLAWEAWLEGLYDGHEFAELATEYKRLPARFREDPRFLKIEGLTAENEKDWPRAIAAYRRAHAREPHDGVLGYRLRQALWLAGDKKEAERMTREFADFQASFKALRPVYEEAFKDPTLGVADHAELYQKLADLREKMGRLDEARAWHQLVLRDSPDDPVSMAALERLK